MRSESVKPDKVTSDGEEWPSLISVAAAAAAAPAAAAPASTSSHDGSPTAYILLHTPSPCCMSTPTLISSLPPSVSQSASLPIKMKSYITPSRQFFVTVLSAPKTLGKVRGNLNLICLSTPRALCLCTCMERSPSTQPCRHNIPTLDSLLQLHL